VMLHDSGNRYASKIFNDDWMSNNGYLDHSFNVQIKDVLKLLGKTNRGVVTVQDTSTIGEVINLMEKNGVSQIPVIGRNGVLGIVSEKNLLRPVVMGEFKKDDNISLAINPQFRIVDANDLLSSVADGLLKKEVALVTQGEKIVDILTDIDVLQYVSVTQNS